MIKRIAAMLVASVVSISVLCGCSGANGETNGSIVDYANAVLQKEQVTLFDFESSDELDSLLMVKANDKSLYSDDAIQKAFEKTNGCGSEGMTALKEAMMAQIPESDYDFISPDKNENGVVQVLKVYNASGTWSEKEALEKIVDLHSMDICEGNYPSKYTYFGEISAVKVREPEGNCMGGSHFDNWRTKSIIL